MTGVLTVPPTLNPLGPLGRQRRCRQAEAPSSEAEGDRQAPGSAATRAPHTRAAMPAPALGPSSHGRGRGRRGGSGRDRVGVRARQGPRHERWTPTLLHRKAAFKPEDQGPGGDAQSPAPLTCPHPPATGEEGRRRQARPLSYNHAPRREAPRGAALPAPPATLPQGWALRPSSRLLVPPPRARELGRWHMGPRRTLCRAAEGPGSAGSPPGARAA